MERGQGNGNKRVKNTCNRANMALEMAGNRGWRPATGNDVIKGSNYDVTNQIV